MKIEPVKSLKNPKALLASRAFLESARNAERRIAELATIPGDKASLARVYAQAADTMVEIKIQGLTTAAEYYDLFDKISGLMGDNGVKGTFQKHTLSVTAAPAVFMDAFTPTDYRGWEKPKWYQKLGFDKIDWASVRWVGYPYFPSHTGPF